MPNQSQNAILKLGSKKENERKKTECLRAPAAACEAEASLALVVPHELCASVPVRGGGRLPTTGREVDTAPALTQAGWTFVGYTVAEVADQCLL